MVGCVGCRAIHVLSGSCKLCAISNPVNFCRALSLALGLALACESFLWPCVRCRSVSQSLADVTKSA
jgi:hypothetical protein